MALAEQAAEIVALADRVAAVEAQQGELMALPARVRSLEAEVAALARRIEALTKGGDAAGAAAPRAGKAKGGQ